MSRTSLCCFSALFLTLSPAAHAANWVVPTAQELHMSAPADDPGANAVYLSYDENDDDQRNVHSIDVRLKVLTEAGVKRYADVEVNFSGRHFSVGDVEARTIHSDGTVIPFTGKPFVKTLRHRGETYKGTVFSMPDVQPGSILEYRYRLDYDDNMVLPARWYLQQDAYALHEHFIFKPLDQSGSKYVVLDHGQSSHGLFYVSSLPKTAKIVPDNSTAHPYYELTVEDVPALPDEEALPPLNSFSYRMLFYYAAQLSADDYWKTEGKFFSKDVNRFAVAGVKMRSDIAALTAASDTPEVKARKLYAAAMKIENTDFVSIHSQADDHAQGLREVRTAEDIWDRQRGSSDEIAMTYLAMLRQAGIQAYAMRVTDRDHNIFEPSYIDTSQLNDTIVIAAINGQEVFLDPGSRFCPYGQLAWPHSWAKGIRQTSTGTAIAVSGPLKYQDTFLHRIAVLTVQPDGMASGTVTLTYTGQAATAIRQRETGEAPADTRQRFEETLRAMLPGGMQLHVISMENLEDGEKPLAVTFGVSGPIGTVSGHRLLVSESLLRGDEPGRFTSPVRKNGVYFHYPYASTDVVQLQLSPGIKLEALPQTQKTLVLGQFAYTIQATDKGDTVRLEREVAMNGLLVPVSDYPKLRQFFGDLRAADDNQLLLVRTAAAEPGGPKESGANAQ